MNYHTAVGSQRTTLYHITQPLQEPMRAGCVLIGLCSPNQPSEERWACIPANSMHMHSILDVTRGLDDLLRLDFMTRSIKTEWQLPCGLSRNSSGVGGISKPAITPTSPSVAVRFPRESGWEQPRWNLDCGLITGLLNSLLRLPFIFLDSMTYVETLSICKTW